MLRRTTAVAAAALGAALLLLVTGRTWFTVTGTGQVPLPPVDVSGSSVSPGIPALALVALAGAGGLLAARGVLRRLVGVLLAAAGAAVVVLAGTDGLLPGARDAALQAARDDLPLVSSSEVTATVLWPLLALVAGALVAAAGAAALVAGARWSGLGARYDSPSGRGAGRVRSDWEALDQGVDPTGD